MANGVDWTPWILFVLTYIASALTGLSVVLLDSKEPLSARVVLGTVIKYGALGSGLGMIGYEYFGGKQSPWRVIAAGQLVGARALKLSDIQNLVRRILNLPPSKDDEDKGK